MHADRSNLMSVILDNMCSLVGHIDLVLWLFKMHDWSCSSRCTNGQISGKVLSRVASFLVPPPSVSPQNLGSFSTSYAATASPGTFKDVVESRSIKHRLGYSVAIKWAFFSHCP